MGGLSASQLICVWERGLGQLSVERALTLLTAGSPERSAEQLASLSVGERDARLLDLREATFGPALNSYTECPNCAEHLEFVIDAAEIRSCTNAAGKPIGAGESRQMETGSFQIRFRLPDSTDLTAAARCKDTAEARRMILHRCLLEAQHGEVRVTTEELPEPIIADFAARLAECDPQAEVLLDLQCPACQHPWQITLDIAPFFWQEINAVAKRLLQEVATLARAYGWSEADILAMSAMRRQPYLEMVS